MMAMRSGSQRDLANLTYKKYGKAAGVVTPGDKAARTPREVLDLVSQTKSWGVIKAASDRYLIEKDPRYQKAKAQTDEVSRMAEKMRARVDATRSQVDEMAKRAEATRVETERIRSNTEQQRMHTESRMNTARKKFGKRAVAKVERKLNSGANAARSLTDVASMVRTARARF